jgi:hypothetical protein
VIIIKKIGFFFIKDTTPETGSGFIPSGSPWDAAGNPG